MVKAICAYCGRTKQIRSTSVAPLCSLCYNELFDQFQQKCPERCAQPGKFCFPMRCCFKLDFKDFITKCVGKTSNSVIKGGIKC